MPAALYTAGMMLVLVFAGLMAFGILYALLIHRLHTRQWIAKRSMLAAFGVAVVVCAAGILHQSHPVIDAMMTLAAFTAAGIPVILWDVTHS